MKKPTPTYRLHKPSGRAVVTISGKDHYLGVHGSEESRENYHRLIAEWLTSERTRRAKEASGEKPAHEPTVGEVILAFWSHAEEHYRSSDGVLSEEMGNLKVALRPLRKLYGDTPAREFGPLALRAVREDMVGAGLARTSINSRINRIRRVFKWAASIELIPVSVVQSLATVAGLQKGRTTARETEPIGPVSMDVVEKTLPFLPRPVVGLIRLQLLTGMRPGEACHIRGVDISRVGEVPIYRPASHKSAWKGKGRAIPLGPRAVELLGGFLKDDPQAYLFSPAESVAEFHGKRQEARKSKATPSEVAKRASVPGESHATKYKRNTYRHAINRACDKAFPHPTLSTIKPSNLTESEVAELSAWRKEHRWHPNQLRHTLATEVRARFGLEAAQVVLGHAKADTTQIYAERDLDKAIDVMREIDELTIIQTSSFLRSWQGRHHHPVDDE